MPAPRRLLKPRILALVTTAKCTAACDHCCIASSPRATAAIPIPRLHGLIDEAARIQSIECIAFTGGECFTLGKDLDALVHRADSHGLVTRCITNAYWAVNDRAAYQRLKRLRQAGLDQLSISTGTFHSQYVPVDRVIRGASIAVELGIMAGIYIESFAESTFDKDLIWQNRTLRRYYNQHRLDIEENIWLPNQGGHGVAQLTQPPSLNRFARGRKTRCKTILHTITVDPRQRLVACCGFPMSYVDQLILGSVEVTPLDELIGTADVDLLKMWIHVEGPERILEFVKTKDPDFQLPTDVSHICATCTRLHRDKVALRVIAQYSEEVEERILSRYARLMHRSRHS